MMMQNGVSHPDTVGAVSQVNSYFFASRGDSVNDKRGPCIFYRTRVQMEIH